MADGKFSLYPDYDHDPNIKRYDFPSDFMFGVGTSAYQDDVQLLKKMGVNYFRFSISWSRILPGEINKLISEQLEIRSWLR
ncbi:putative beta-glucosidase [Helianthus annuus]|nr:putative beta-glucosidase [Helianthus annuus]KAJ0499753.1 putative beta-glucosidase [Helianthus annuus]